MTQSADLAGLLLVAGGRWQTFLAGKLADG